MASTALMGEVVTFIASGDTDTTEAGVVIGNPSTTSVRVAYDFVLSNADQVKHCKEMVTTDVTVVSNLVN